ncbi:thermonuclease family protein [Paroceanicella profunda]|uniref:Thermonuclease family protein n=1 Tax=Paroceanicella profunda TaxID=2579971 RepID=A0A5B8FY74_9RHOB|nr:thermonuclease family protein [Paroceanicella profunda]QDL92564.1 thermonuclease family protein [Paroceanicella profunda]
MIAIHPVDITSMHFWGCSEMRSRAYLVAATLSLAAASSACGDDLPDCGLYAYRADITRVIDGDTVVANVDLGFDVWLHNEHLRLYQVQAPERGEAGYDEAEEALRARVEGKSLYICTHQMKRLDREATGSFGRYLVTLYEGGESVNDWLVREGFAVEYLR